MILPAARSVAEARLYMELHGCPTCGETSFTPDSAIITLPDGDLGRRYSGPCPRCGTAREVIFRLADDPAPRLASGFSYGGPEASRLIGPEQWLAASDAYAGQAPADTAGLAGDQLRHAEAVLVRAAAAIDEVLKFIPDGADQPPAERITGDASRFRRARLTAVRDAYAGMLRQV